uniref:NADH-ubiquinone oxidoreductase chain 1 n=1 Tax=Pneumocystis carinii TaxID=4754 RepID=D2XDV5_PNECA|nr:NADH dehydrogenase subunit 1 [Pneumocystis carinii]ACZ82945.1 NADH dehydrogenase subunit 1 [Pneumocystis carinii]AFR90436.1 NADH dehydrogenase subunit 1 [Pneumocystis carinii]
MLFEVLVLIVSVLLSVAYLTLAERKVMGSMQRRLGPNAVGYYGLLQPFADALKLIVKETIIPSQANKILFFLGPMIALVFALLGWGLIPYGPGATICDFELGVLYSLAISSVGVYGILIGGWSSNSKYALVGSLRSTAQLISYELVLTSIVFIIVFFSGTLNWTQLVEAQHSIWYCIPLLPLFVMYFIGALAETNRAPFDLPEAESELVAGFMTEYSAAIFVYYFLAEYGNILLISTLSVIFFLGGYLLPFEGCLQLVGIGLQSITGYRVPILFLTSSVTEGIFYGLSLGIKVSLLIFLFIWVRASFPRIRYDQLILFCWTVFLPLLFAWIFFIAAVLYSFNSLPTSI